LTNAAPKPLAWITGATGFIGNYLVRTAPEFAPRWRVIAVVRDGNMPSLPHAGRDAVPASPIPSGNVRCLDLTDFDAVRHAFQSDSPQLVIHCAAITTSAEAQANPTLARRVNVEVTKWLAELAAAVQFVFFSTDLVFDGRKGNYVETDTANPIHIYGETKLAAEQIVLKNPRHLVVRTSLNAGVSRAGNRGFNEQLRLALRAGQGMTLFTDEFRCPIPAVETARAVWELANKSCAGLFHVAGAEKLSRWQIGQLLVQRRPELAGKIKPGSARDFPGPPRALDTSLDIARVQGILSAPLPGLSEWLAANPDETF
jgi:dTDP-4-dehydrorhamnose reductase